MISLGNSKIGGLYLGSTKISDAYIGATKIFSSAPVVLPPFTIRMLFNNGVTPSFSKGTLVQVSSSPNVWDLTYENTDWSSLCIRQYDMNKIIAANTSGVTNTTMMFYRCNALTSVSLFDTSAVTKMSLMFYSCSALTSVPLFDTSSATRVDEMLSSCTALTSVPLFDTSSATNMSGMFYNCYNVQSGALALYQQASTHAATPYLQHNNTFKNCGRDTTTGAAELAQIPTNWGGTMA